MQDLTPAFDPGVAFGRDKVNMDSRFRGNDSIEVLGFYHAPTKQTA